MSRKIFFSYGHDENKQYVYQIAKILETEGFEVFVDNYELKAGKDWEFKLEKGISESEKVVFFITPHSARRPDGYCLNEIAMASYLNKEIIPVMLEDYSPPLSIIRLQYLDMRPFKDEEKLKKFAKELIAVLNNDKTLDEEGAYANIVHKLKPLDFTQNFKAHSQIIGRVWIVDEVNKWLESHPKSKILWLTAEAGYGKSAIAAFLTRTHPDVVGVHFCSYNHPSKNAPHNMIKTLAYHFQSQIKGYANEIIYEELENKNAFELFEVLIANPLARVKHEGKRFIFVIDALDEALSMDEEMVELIGSEVFQNGLPDYVKIIVTSRVEPRLKQVFSGMNPVMLDAEKQENIEDCKVFIEQKISSVEKTSELNIDELTERLMEVSAGNMLYLTMFFKELEHGIVDLDKAETFPQGLNGIYKSFFERITKDEEIFDDTFAPVLELMLAYGEPIPKILIEDILGFSSKKLRRVLSKMGTLLIDDGKTVDIYHKSMKDWLCDDANDKYWIDVKEGENKLNSFIEKLSEKNYKEEYFCNSLNKKIVDTFSKSINDINRFLDMLIKIEDVKVVKSFNTLFIDYASENKFTIAVLIGEESLKRLQVLYLRNPEEWKEEYSYTLTYLAYPYRMCKRSNDAIITSEQSLRICKDWYEESMTERSAYFYVITIKTLLLSYSSLYGKINQDRKKIEKYIIELSNECLTICEKYIIVKPEKWTGILSSSLSTISHSLESIGRIEEAMFWRKKSLHMYERLYKKNPESYYEVIAYTNALFNISNLYRKMDRIDKKIEFKKKILEVYKRLYVMEPKKWLNKYSSSLTSIGKIYQKTGNIDEAICVFESVLDINKNHTDHNLLLNNASIMAILATLYNQKYQEEKVKNLYKKRIEIYKKLFIEDPAKFGRRYYYVLDRESRNQKEVSETIEVNLELLNICRVLNKVDSKKWERRYLRILNRLIRFYKKNKAKGIELNSLYVEREKINTQIEEVV